jgi:hypothetical protein
VRQNILKGSTSQWSKDANFMAGRRCSLYGRQRERERKRGGERRGKREREKDQGPNISCKSMLSQRPNFLPLGPTS